MDTCQVGMFKMPGLTFKPDEVPESLTEEMVAWATENHCGKKMTETLWSFRNEKQREWFILRWSDQVAKNKPTT